MAEGGIRVTRYNAQDIVVMINDICILGLGEDMVSINKAEEFYERTTGGQGDVVKSEKNDTLGEAELSLQLTSPQFSMCIDLANKREDFSFWVIDTKNKRRYGGSSAAFTNYPEVAFAKEHEDVSFNIGIDDYGIVNE